MAFNLAWPKSCTGPRPEDISRGSAAHLKAARAFASFEKHKKGSTEQGKLAKPFVLGADPTQVDPISIKDIAVEITIGGEAVYGGVIDAPS